MDPAEKIIFKNLASCWYTQEMEALHVLNDLRIPAIVQGLESVGSTRRENHGSNRPLAGLSILDVGCGGGFVSEALAKLGAEVVGVDGVPELIEVAEKHAAGDKTLANLTYVVEAIEDFAPKCTKQFDVVLALEVLDHVIEKQGFIDATVKCLKPGGSLFLSTMDKSWTSWLYCKIIPEYVSKWIPAGTHHYDQFISAGDVEKMLKSHNIKTKSLKGMYYNHRGKNWYWIKSTSSWYFMHALKQK